MKQEQTLRIRGRLAFLGGVFWTITLLATQTGAAQVPQPEGGSLCGTPGASNPSAGYNPGMRAEGRDRNGALIPVRIPFGNVVERPTGAAGQVLPPRAPAPP